MLQCCFQNKPTARETKSNQLSNRLPPSHFPHNLISQHCCGKCVLFFSYFPQKRRKRTTQHPKQNCLLCRNANTKTQKKTDRGPKHDRQTPTQPSGGLMVVVMVVVARITSCTIPSLFFQTLHLLAFVFAHTLSPTSLVQVLWSTRSRPHEGTWYSRIFVTVAPGGSFTVCESVKSTVVAAAVRTFITLRARGLPGCV